MAEMNVVGVPENNAVVKFVERREGVKKKGSAVLRISWTGIVEGLGDRVWSIWFSNGQLRRELKYALKLMGFRQDGYVIRAREEDFKEAEIPVLAEMLARQGVELIVEVNGARIEFRIKEEGGEWK